MSLFARFRHRLRKPLEVTPLKLAPFGAAVVAILLAISLFPDGVPRKPVADPSAVARKAGKVNVQFTLNIPASKVAVIGSFNEWKSAGFQMQRDATRGVWTFTLPLEKGRYEYAFLVDGTKMIPDPNALMQEEDGFGGRNSILILERDDDHGNGV
jgi:1,4-alpha-glucan branching enzyme